MTPAHFVHALHAGEESAHGGPRRLSFSGRKHCRRVARVVK